MNPVLTRFGLLMTAALWLSVVGNVVTLKNFYAAAMTPSLALRVLFTLGGWLFIVFVMLVFLHLVSLPFRGKSVRIPIIIAIVSGAALSHFSWAVGMQFDKTMLQNLLQTDVAEARDLMTWKLALWMLVLGVLPAIFVWRVRMANETNAWWRRAMKATLVVAGILALTLGVLLSQYARYASAVRNHAVKFHTVAPVNFVAASVALWAQNRDVAVVRAPFGPDAKQAAPLAKPRMVIFVLGETARAQNVGLNGYARDTTPRMRELGGVYFPNTQSCGTTTAVSVPCIFSGMTRETYSSSKARSQQTLVDVMRYAGTTVLWRENDGGCKGVCSGAQVEEFNNAKHVNWCPENGNCHDEVMLEGLAEHMRKSAAGRDVIMFLHVKGSHGPAYFKRYPKAFERFSPACQSIDLSQCSADEIRNAYDNTIVYTDHVVGRAAELLKAHESDYATALFFVSDHGESLGENGMYLHGLPYAMAPETQTRVPMYAWFSPQFLSLAKMDESCVKASAQTPRSHDNVFHTTLGMMGIASSVYSPNLDLFAACVKR